MFRLDELDWVVDLLLLLPIELVVDERAEDSLPSMRDGAGGSEVGERSAGGGLGVARGCSSRIGVMLVGGGGVGGLRGGMMGGSRRGLRSARPFRRLAWN